MTLPPYTPAEARTRATFLALMNALSRPGQSQPLPTGDNLYDALCVIGETLLDLETSFFTPDARLSVLLGRTTARPESAERAEYLFYPAFATPDLETVARAKIGTMLFPDQAATLIVGCANCLFTADAFTADADQGTLLRLSGPGVQGQAQLALSGIPAQFWALRESRRRYPLGWDVYLVSGSRVIGLPRSTAITGWEQGE